VGTYPDPTSILTRDTVRTAPMHVNWGDVNLDGLPKVARLEPIRTRRWPWVVFGLIAGAAAAVYFWLPRFDTQALPPEVAAVVEPLKTAIASNSPGSTNSPADATQGSTAPGTSGSDAAAQSSALQTHGSQLPGPGATGSQASAARASGSQAREAQRTASQTPATRAGKSAGATGTAGANATAVAGKQAGTATPAASARVSPATGLEAATPPRVSQAAAPGAGATGTATSPRISPATAFGTAVASVAAPNSAAASTATAASTQPFTAADEQRLRQARQLFDNRLASLEARGAGAWGGREFAMAKTRAAESVGAHDAGNPRISQERLAAATKLLDTVESKAPQALSAEVAAGEQALGAGQQEVAGQAFDLARRINPNDRRATDGQRRAQNLPAILPLLADAQNAEAAHDYARAAQDYSQALSLDPGNATAKAGQARANAAFGDDSYARAVGSGFAALGAGRLDEAHEAFVKARALNPKGAEASEGLRRVGAALTARGFASMRQRALGLESQERWDEAERTYEDVLAADSSLAFAQEGKARTTSRADLSLRLQQILDRPDRLTAPGVREDARALLETARAQSPQGPVIRSQIARLEILIPGFDRPVHLSLVSDNSTQVAIPSIGAFGTFSRRDIELRPGRYTVVGTRNGFRDVRREITVAPGQDSQTIRVTCSEPI
jgi:tetratricopeptide (TPR) repeat protein